MANSGTRPLNQPESAGCAVESSSNNPRLVQRNRVSFKPYGASPVKTREQNPPSRIEPGCEVYPLPAASTRLDQKVHQSEEQSQHERSKDYEKIRHSIRLQLLDGTQQIQPLCSGCNQHPDQGRQVQRPKQHDGDDDTRQHPSGVPKTIVFPPARDQRAGEYNTKRLSKPGSRVSQGLHQPRGSTKPNNWNRKTYTITPVIDT